MTSVKLAVVVCGMGLALVPRRENGSGLKAGGFFEGGWLFPLKVDFGMIEPSGSRKGEMLPSTSVVWSGVRFGADKRVLKAEWRKVVGLASTGDEVPSLKRDTSTEFLESGLTFRFFDKL